MGIGVSGWYLPPFQTSSLPGEEFSLWGCPVTKGQHWSLAESHTSLDLRGSQRKIHSLVSGCEMLVLQARLSWKTSCEPTQQKSVSRLGGNTSIQLLVFSSVEVGPSFCSLPHPEIFLQYFSENTGLFHHESQLSGSKAKRSQTPLPWSSISNNSSFGKRLKLLISRSPSWTPFPIPIFLVFSKHLTSLNPWLLQLLSFCKHTFFGEVWTALRVFSLTHSPSLKSISACPVFNHFWLKGKSKANEQINGHLNVCSVAYHVTKIVIS